MAPPSATPGRFAAVASLNILVRNGMYALLMVSDLRFDKMNGHLRLFRQFPQLFKLSSIVGIHCRRFHADHGHRIAEVKERPLCFEAQTFWTLGHALDEARSVPHL